MLGAAVAEDSRRLLTTFLQASPTGSSEGCEAIEISEGSSELTVAGWTGLEPAASGVTGRRYNQLNYHPRMCRPVVYMAPTDVSTSRPCRTRRSSSALFWVDRKSTRLNSSHDQISYAVFCLKKKK